MNKKWKEPRNKYKNDWRRLVKKRKISIINAFWMCNKELIILPKNMNNQCLRKLKGSIWIWLKLLSDSYSKQESRDSNLCKEILNIKREWETFNYGSKKWKKRSKLHSHLSYRKSTVNLANLSKSTSGCWSGWRARRRRGTISWKGERRSLRAACRRRRGWRWRCTSRIRIGFRRNSGTFTVKWQFNMKISSNRNSRKYLWIVRKNWKNSKAKLWNCKSLIES